MAAPLPFVDKRGRVVFPPGYDARGRLLGHEDTSALAKSQKGSLQSPPRKGRAFSDFAKTIDSEGEQGRSQASASTASKQMGDDAVGDTASETDEMRAIFTHTPAAELKAQWFYKKAKPEPVLSGSSSLGAADLLVVPTMAVTSSVLGAPAKTHADEWVAYEALENKVLEQAFANGHDRVEFGAGNLPAYVKLRRQHNEFEHKDRVMLRGTWFWQRGDGSWQPYSEAVAASLELSFGAEEHLVIHEGAGNEQEDEGASSERQGGGAEPAWVRGRTDVWSSLEEGVPVEEAWGPAWLAHLPAREADRWLLRYPRGRLFVHRAVQGGFVQLNVETGKVRRVSTRYEPSASAPILASTTAKTDTLTPLLRSFRPPPAKPAPPAAPPAAAWSLSEGWDWQSLTKAVVVPGGLGPDSGKADAVQGKASAVPAPPPLSFQDVAEVLGLGVNPRTPAEALRSHRSAELKPAPKEDASSWGALNLWAASDGAARAHGGVRARPRPGDAKVSSKLAGASHGKIPGSLWPPTVAAEDEAAVGVILGYEMQASFCTGFLVVEDLVAGSPAHLSGMVKVGHRLVAIDGTCVFGVSIIHAARRLQGREKSVVSMTLRDPTTGADETIKFARRHALPHYSTLPHTPSRQAEPVKAVGFGFIRDARSYDLPSPQAPHVLKASVLSSLARPGVQTAERLRDKQTSLPLPPSLGPVSYKFL